MEVYKLPVYFFDVYSLSLKDFISLWGTYLKNLPLYEFHYVCSLLDNRHHNITINTFPPFLKKQYEQLYSSYAWGQFGQIDFTFFDPVELEVFKELYKIDKEVVENIINIFSSLNDYEKSGWYILQDGEEISVTMNGNYQGLSYYYYIETTGILIQDCVNFCKLVNDNTIYFKTN